MSNKMLHTNLHRQRLMLLVYGHAMPSNLLLCGDIGIAAAGSGAVRVAPATFVAQGSSVPIFRGDPPLLKE